jgi:hypothetical protein
MVHVDPLTKRNIAQIRRQPKVGYRSINRWMRSTRTSLSRDGAAAITARARSRAREISARCTLVASIRGATSPSLVGRPRRRRAPRSLAQNVQVRGQLAHLALEPIDFFLAQRFVFFLASTKCVLRPEQEAIALLFHLGDLSAPWRRAASTAVVSPLSKLIIKAARRLAVQRCTSSGRRSAPFATSQGFDLVLLVFELKGAQNIADLAFGAPERANAQARIPGLYGAARSLGDSQSPLPPARSGVKWRIEVPTLLQKRRH